MENLVKTCIREEKKCFVDLDLGNGRIAPLPIVVKAGKRVVQCVLLCC